MEHLRIHHISFKNAISGIKWSVSTQPNFKVHLLLSSLALLLGYLLKVTFLEITVIVFCIVLGIAAEMINTSIESMCDLITTEWKKEAKIAKDVSAGMMLIVATGTFIVAGFIFIPKILMFLSQ